jgi:hypothetical protein
MISRKKAVAFIDGRHGKVFSVVFVKRTTGEEREMVCRQGVTKHLAGGEAAYNFSEKKLIPVYDMRVEGYRSIPVEGIIRIKIDGEWHDVK